MSSAGHEASHAPAQPQKFSRYRSVRKNQHNDAMVSDQPSSVTSAPMPSGTPSAKTQESIKRSMSRYRNRQGPSKITSVPLPPPPPVLAMRNRPHTNDTGDNALKNGNQHYNSSVDHERPEEESRGAQAGEEQKLPFHSAPKIPASQLSNRALHNDITSDRNNNDHQESHRQPGANNGVDEQCATGTKRLSFLEKLREETSGRFHSKSRPPSPVSPGGQGYMHRSMEEELQANARAAEKHGRRPMKQVKEKKSGSLFSRFKSFEAGLGSKAKDENKENWKDMISAPQPVDPSAVSKPAPAGDTPVSAVNAGEREVQVICGGALISLPVTPTTTAYDILTSVANNQEDERGIKPQDSILGESFKQLGLQRPLRGYEYVRDVMNSWDHGSRNHLHAAPRSTEHSEEDEELLEAQYAPVKQPSEACFQLHHSQRSGKWDKRWITLKPDGQVHMAKKEGVDVSNICHMSDFDIYQLSREEFRRVKSPKKFCYAVKSQQKSSMFLSREKYVHYFASNDKDVALRWYRAMQQWRSWYLLNMVGAGQDDDDNENDNNNKLRTEGSGVQQNGNGSAVNSRSTSKWNMKAAATPPMPDQRNSSAPGSTHSHKRHQPKANVHSPENQIHPGHGAQESYASPQGYGREPSGRQRPSKSCPSSPKLASHTPFNGERSSVRSPPRYRHNSNKLPSQTAQDANGEPFAPTSLLGRTYTQRQNAMREREKESSQDGGPFTKNGLLGNLEPGQQLPNSDPPSRQESVRHNQRQPPKPLVDLTPTYQEPPQHRHKGRGAAADPGTLLVENATGPDLAPGAIVVPSATTWKKPDPPAVEPGVGGGGAGAGGRQRAGTQRSQRRQQARGRTSADIGSRSPPASPTEASPFSPTGLVAQSARANTTWGTATTGRGVATGDRNAVGKPLLDMSEPSQFAAGSLLHSVEKQGPGVAAGDRDRS